MLHPPTILQPMVRQKKVKAARRANLRTYDQLRLKLREQYSLLEAQAQIYDDGKHVIALSGATTLRVLLHNTNNSHSLLSQMGMISSLRFIDTAQHIVPNNLVGNPGLVHMHIEPGNGAKFEPPLDNLSPPRRSQPPLQFQQWWTTPIVKGPTGATWSRKDLVLYQTNKEGGAHLDPELSDADLREVEQESFGFRFIDEDGTSKPLNGFLFPSIRQIMFEALNTIASLTIEDL